SRLLEEPEPRAPYLPAETFFTPSGLPAFAKEAAQHHRLGPTASAVSGQQIRYSPATLQFLTDAHRLVAAETHGLGLAAAELFRRCERMRSELLDQIRRVRDIRDKVDVVVGSDEGGSEADSQGEGGSLEKKDRVEVRVNEAHERSVELNERVERLRSKMGRLGGGASGGRPLSVREQGFAKEVERVRVSVGAGEEDGGGEGAGMGLLSAPGDEKVEEGQVAGEGEQQQTANSLGMRLQAARELQERLVRQAGEAVENAEQRRGGAADEGDSSGTKRFGSGSAATPVHGDFRRQKLQQVMALLERETALVEGVAERLARLGVSA
ncbi:hypothetical protein KC334_g14647, partial [Hortaea werneckii]